MSNSGVERGTLAGSLYEQLTCPICLDIFTDPRMLPCQHSFCSECIIQLITIKTSPESNIECPECKVKHLIPTDGNFPKDFKLGSLIDLLNAHSNDPAAHSINEATPITPMSSLTPTTETPVVLCPSHNIPMECYCVDCKLLVCESCPRSEHRTHTIDKLDRLKSTYVDELRSLVIECEKRVIALDTEADSLSQKDSAAVSTCRKSIDKYYNEHEEIIENKIAKLNAKLQAVKLRHETLVKKLYGFSNMQDKKRAIDKDTIEQLKESVSRTITSAGSLIHSNDASMVVHKYDQVKEELKNASCTQVDHTSLQPIPIISLSRDNDPLVCELIDSHSVSVQGMGKVAKPGANSFTLSLTTPLINKPRFKIIITLPNGRKADGMKFESLGENSWLVSFYVPPTSFSLTSLFSSGNNKVTISIMLCDIEIEGSPFILPCNKLV